MAWQVPHFTPGGLSAAADLSSKQFYFVKLTAANQVDLCTVDGEFAIGVLQNKPIAGTAAAVEFSGVSKVVAGESLLPGMFVGTDTAGRAKQVDMTATGADLGDWIVGSVLEGAGTNEIATVKLGTPYYRVTA